MHLKAVRRLTKQPKLTAIIQSHRLTLFGHIMRMDDNADAKRILLASPPADWRRQLGRHRIMWLSTIQQDLKQHHLTLPEATYLAQNRPLWMMMSTYGAMQSWVACQKRRRRRLCTAFSGGVVFTMSRCLPSTNIDLSAGQVVRASPLYTCYYIGTKWPWVVYCCVVNYLRQQGGGYLIVLSVIRSVIL